MIGVAAQTTSTSLEGLVRLAAAGDDAAFAAIVRRHHVDMVRVAFLVAGDADIAEDATASAWPIAWKRLRSLREPDRLRPWLCSIAANEARQLVRRRRRRTIREIQVDGVNLSAFPDPASRNEDLDLAQALSRLTAEERSLLALRYVAGLNATELGAATGMSPSGTRARLARLLARLRKELSDD